MDRIKKRIQRERTLGKVLMAMFMLLLTGVIAGIGINRVRKDFTLAFKDHMFPTLDIFHAVERQYQNRYLLDELITGTGRSQQLLIFDIKKNNKIIDSISNHYLTSHTIESIEQQDFKNFQLAAANYRKFENQVIGLCQSNQSDSARHLYQAQSQELFLKAVEPIDRLEEDQISYIAAIFKEAETTGKQVSTIIYMMGLLSVIYAIWLAIRYARQHLAD